MQSGGSLPDFAAVAGIEPSGAELSGQRHTKRLAAGSSLMEERKGPDAELKILRRATRLVKKVFAIPLIAFYKSSSVDCLRFGLTL